MGVTYKTLKTDREWKSNTGLSEPEFHTLARAYRAAYESIYLNNVEERQANSTQEAIFKTCEDQLFFLLFSLKTGLTYDSLAFVFGCSQPVAKTNQDLFLKILEVALHQSGAMPRREFSDPNDFNSYFESHKTLILDGTEQSIQRPKDKELQKAHYSGKKKTYR
jgi:hypothetical protein